MLKILIATTRRQLRETLRNSFAGTEFEIVEVTNDKELIRLLPAVQPNIVLIDAKTPTFEGVEICKEVRQYSDVPIILLIKRTELDIGIEALEIGADDFILKPLNTRELLARIKSLLKRLPSVQMTKRIEKIHYDNLDINFAKHKVVSYGREVCLTTKELNLLVMLAKSPNQAFPRMQLLEEVWGNEAHENTRTLDTHIKSIRQKLNVPADSTWRIATIWTIGYMFELN